MAGITLRDYVREIEKQIDGGRAEEALAHSRHILEIYPKCVDAYRLLGKAFLESQRYGDAGDIFQRVLSSIPDDFVAHVGMSIIREDEGNLDESIWHMERAYEVQPSNGAIQEELRRLYNRRDNVEPPKIRLTRGALARMYFKGDLHQQAIAEVRAALAEDPDRLDLQVLLANIYSQAGMRAEAVDMANNLLQRLPYCLVANRIMVDILTASDRGSEADQFRQRMNQLDPYTVHLSPEHPDTESIPDNAIKIDRLDYKPGAAPQSDQPTWASSLGVDLGKSDLTSEAPLPDWLSPIGAKLPESTPEPSAFQPSTPAFDMSDDFLIGGTQPPVIPEQPAVPAEEIPDWMQSMGWQPITDEGRQAEVGYKFEEPETPSPMEEGELVAAEIPDWLKSMAPEETEPAVPAGGEEDVTPWLDGLMDGTPPPVAPQVTPVEDEAAEGLPDWLAAIPEEGAEPSVESAEALPDWLSGGELETAGPSEGAELLPDWLSAGPTEGAGAVESTESIPDWLSGLGGSAMSEFAQADEAAQSLPDWLSGEIMEPPSEAAPQAATAEELPDWLSDVSVPKSDIETPLAQPVEELPDWLNETPVAAPTQEEPPVPQTAKPSEELPDWMLEAAEAEATKPVTASPTGDEEWPDWLLASTGQSARSQVPVEEKISEAVELPQAEDIADEVPDWLREAGDFMDITEGGTAEVPAEIPGEVAAEPAEALPEWLMEAEVPVEIQEEVQAAPAEALPEWLMEAEEPAGVQEETPAALAEALPEWLMEIESPAEGQEEVQATLAEALPEWLIETEEPAGIEEEAPAALAEALPEWLMEAAEPVEVQEEALATSEESLPEWLREAEVPIEVQEEVPAAPAAVLPEWLVEGEEPAGVQEEALLAPAEALPDWLMEAGGPADVQEETPAASEAALPEWLMEAEAPVEMQEEAAAAPAEALPEWLMEAEEPAEVQEEPPAAPAEALPEWLMGAEAPAEIQEEAAAVPAEALPEWLMEAEEPAEVQEEIPAAPAEALPEWLMGAEAPAEMQEEAAATPAEALPDWLMGVEAPAEAQEELTAEPAEALPDWLMGAEAPAEVQEDLPTEPAEALPDWLMGVEASTQVQEEIPAVESEIDLGDTQPTRVAHAPEITAEAPIPVLPVEESEEDLDEAFAWLDQLLAPVEPEGPTAPFGPVEPVTLVEMTEPVVPIETTPVSKFLPPADVELQDFASLQEALPQKPEAVPTISTTPAQSGSGLLDADDAFAWLEALAVKQGASEALLLKPEDRAEKPPEWIQHELDQAGSLLQTEEISIEPPVEGIEPSISEVELTDEARMEIPIFSAGIETPVEAEGQKTLAPLAEVETPSEPEAQIEFEQPAPPEVENPVAAAPEAEMPVNPDDAFAWLEALAVKQGATEALLLTPEERTETPPDWVLQQEAELPFEPEAQVMIEEPEPQQAETLAEAVLEVEAPAAIEPEAESPAAPELEVETAKAAAPEAEMPINPDDAFAWLEALAVKQGATEALLLTPEERTETPPDWVLQQEAESPAPAPDFAAPPGLSSMVGADEISLLEPEAAPEIAEAAISEIGAPAELVTSETELPVVEILPVTVESVLLDVIEPPVETAGLAEPTKKGDTGDLPPLPDWLTGEVTEAAEETEWTPPPVAKRLYDLNRVSLGELERLPGVGFIMAQRIVMYREQHGNFESIDDLLKVPEFSSTTLEDIRDNLFVMPKAVKEGIRPLAKEEPAPVLVSKEGEQPEELAPARGLLEHGELAEAITAYNNVIATRQHLNLIVKDLQEAANTYPKQPMVWQALGDAYIRLDQVREAIEAYAKAEQLLR